MSLSGALQSSGTPTTSPMDALIYPTQQVDWQNTLFDNPSYWWMNNYNQLAKTDPTAAMRYIVRLAQSGNGDAMREWSKMFDAKYGQGASGMWDMYNAGAYGDSGSSINGNTFTTGGNNYTLGTTKPSLFGVSSPTPPAPPAPPAPANNTPTVTTPPSPARSGFAARSLAGYIPYNVKDPNLGNIGAPGWEPTKDNPFFYWPGANNPSNAAGADSTTTTPATPPRVAVDPAGPSAGAGAPATTNSPAGAAAAGNTTNSAAGSPYGTLGGPTAPPTGFDYGPNGVVQPGVSSPANSYGADPMFGQAMAFRFDPNSNDWQNNGIGQDEWKAFTSQYNTLADQSPEAAMAWMFNMGGAGQPYQNMWKAGVDKSIYGAGYNPSGNSWANSVGNKFIDAFNGSGMGAGAATNSFFGSWAPGKFSWSGSDGYSPGNFNGFNYNGNTYNTNSLQSFWNARSSPSSNTGMSANGTFGGIAW